MIKLLVLSVSLNRFFRKIVQVVKELKSRSFLVKRSAKNGSQEIKIKKGQKWEDMPT